MFVIVPMRVTDLEPFISKQAVRKTRKRQSQGERVLEDMRKDLREGGSSIFRFSPPPNSTAVLKTTTRERGWRRTFKDVCSHPVFDAAIMTLIVANSVILATGARLPDVEKAFTAVFILEVVMKLTVYSPRGYFANAWNVFDFLIVASGAFTTFSSQPSVNLTSLRGLRVLRALRAVSTSENMRSIAEALFESIKMMRSISALYVFFLFVISIFGVQFYSGALRYRCMPPPPAFFDALANGTEHHAEDRSSLCIPGDQLGALGDGGGGPCAPGWTCAPGFLNPEGGLVSFDSVPQAAVTMFAAMTLEGWAETLRSVAASTRAGKLSVFYFVISIVFGTYVCVNLIIATLFESHKVARDRIEAIKKLALIKKRIDTWGMCDDRRRTWPCRVRDAIKRWRREAKKRGVYTHGLLHILLDLGYPPLFKMSTTAESEGEARIEELSLPTSALELYVGLCALDVQGTTFSVDEPKLRAVLEQEEAYQSCEHTSHGGGGSDRTILDCLMAGEGRDDDDDAGMGRDGSEVCSAFATRADLQEKPSRADSANSNKRLGAGAGSMTSTSAVVVAAVTHRRQSRAATTAARVWQFMMLLQQIGTWSINMCIAANSIALALETFDQETQAFDPLRLRIIEVTNAIVVVVFTLEAAILIASRGPRRYFCDSWCQIDFFICIVSVVDLLLSGVDIPGVTIMRTVRFVRALRLFRSWSSLNRLLQTMINSFVVVRSFTVFLVFFWLFCALLGHQMMMTPPSGSGSESQHMRSPRYNYDDFVSSLITVFVVMSGENWDEVMWENAAHSMAVEGNTAMNGWMVVAVHMVIFIIGNMIVLNLFLAILLENFDGIIGRENSRDLTEEGGEGREAGVADEEHAVTPIPERRYLSSTAHKQQQHERDSRNVCTVEDKETEEKGDIPDDEKYGDQKNSTAPFPTKAFNGPGSLAYMLEQISHCCSEDEDEEVREEDEEEDASSSSQERNEAEQLLLLYLSHLVVRLGSMETYKVCVGNCVYYNSFLREDLEDWLLSSGEARDLEDTSRIRDCLVFYNILIPVVKPSLAVSMSKLASEELLQIRKELAAHPRVPLRFGNLDPTQVGTEVGIADTLLRSATSSSSSFSFKKSNNRDARSAIRRESTNRMMQEHGRTLWVFRPGDAFRQACANILTHPLFDSCILACIALSSILLAIETPSKQDELEKRNPFFQIADYTMLAIFSVEAVVKITVMGFAVGEKAYVRDAWNALDFCVLVLGILDSTASVYPGMRALRAVRTVRALRPLRALRRNEGLKTLVESLIFSVPSILHVLSIFALVFFAFAVVGMDLFAGRLARCFPSSASTKGTESTHAFAALNISVAACRAAGGGGGEWRNGQWSFDDFGSALLTVLELSLQEMFPSAGLELADATPPGEPPRRDASRWAHAYTFAVIAVCNFFMTNLMTGAVIDNFFRIQNGKIGAASLSQSQLEWAQTQRFLLKVRPMQALRKPQIAIDNHSSSNQVNTCIFRVRCFFFDVVSRQAFENAVLVVIILNTISIAMQFEDQSPAYRNILETYAGNTFSAIYFAEMAAKMIGLGPGQYFASWWNRADFVIISASALGFLTTTSTLSGLAPVLRVFKIVRIMKLVPRFKNLRRVISTFVSTLPSIFNIGLLILLIYFVFAILGMNFFWAASLDGKFLNDFTNFANVGNSMLAVFQSSTGENWNGIMYELAQQGYPVQSRLFFFGLAIVGNLILVNLFVAAVISNFHDETEASGLGVDDLEKFADRWSELATEDSPVFMCSYRLPELIRQIPPPLGVGGTTQLSDDQDMVLFIQKLRLRKYSGRVFYIETILALAATKAESATTIAHDKAAADNAFMQRIAERIRARFSEINSVPRDHVRLADLSNEINAAVVIQSAWKRFAAVRTFARIKQSLHVFSAEKRRGTDETLRQGDVHVSSPTKNGVELVA